MSGGTFHWLDVQRIAEELTDQHPDVDPLSVSFPKLRDLVRSLDGFEEQAEHPVNERILEAIQLAWIDENAD
jgi:FeS assembly protein IscX